MNRIALLLLISLACACTRECIASQPVAKNVVLISIDTLRTDSLRAYAASAPPRPTLDRLAERGHVFERAYSTASWTLPSHVSLFTGLYPRRHGVVDHRQAMGDVSSFVETLRQGGFQTVGFADGGYLSGGYGFSRGFEVYDDWRDENAKISMAPLPRGGKRSLDTRKNLFDRASAFLSHRTDERPLFMFVHSFAVHDYCRSWLPAEAGKKPRPTPESRARLGCLLGKVECPPATWQELKASYEAAIGDLDRALGAFLELVEKTLGADHTLILVLSDHGEGFDHARNRIHHGGRLHRDQLQIPFLVVGPGIEPGRSKSAISLVDVRASVLELTGLSDEVEHDGRSFAPSLFGKSVKARDAVWASEYYHYWQHGRRRHVLQPVQEPLATARIDDRLWYIESTSSEELYDVRDETQSKDLSEQLEKPHDVRPAARGVQPVTVEHTEELIEQLRALGYVE